MSGTRSMRVEEFDVWRPGYAGATVEIYVAGTTALAPVFSDPALTIPAPNPQELRSTTDANGTTYGRWFTPLYVGQPYTLVINGEGQSGIQRLPLYDLAGIDASSATVLPALPGAVPRPLSARAADTINVLDFGVLTNSAAGNNAIITAAIGAASAAGGGVVLLPAESVVVTALTIPANVRLRGAGRKTTKLRSLEGRTIVTITGSQAGLTGISIDGVNGNPGSVGLASAGNDELVLDDFEATALETGMIVRGGAGHVFIETFVSSCQRGARLLGERLSDGTGGSLRDLTWRGGGPVACTISGVTAQVVDSEVLGLKLDGVRFTSNAGPALDLVGARQVTLISPDFSGNIGNIRVSDASDPAFAAINTTRGVSVFGGNFAGGELRFDGAAQGIVFDQTAFQGVSWVASVPANNILVRDCIEDAATQQTGAVDRILRRSGIRGGTFRTTSVGTVPQIMWQYTMGPGEVARIEVSAVGRGEGGGDATSLCLHTTLAREPVRVDFVSASSTILAGSSVTGVNSGATARVGVVSQTGASGFIAIVQVVGAFIPGEQIVFSGGVTATVAAAAVGGIVVQLGTPTFVGGEFRSNASSNIIVEPAGVLARLIVIGVAGQTMNWTVDVNVVSTLRF